MPISNMDARSFAQLLVYTSSAKSDPYWRQSKIWYWTPSQSVRQSAASCRLRYVDTDYVWRLMAGWRLPSLVVHMIQDPIKFGSGSSRIVLPEGGCKKEGPVDGAVVGRRDDSWRQQGRSISIPISTQQYPNAHSTQVYDCIRLVYLSVSQSVECRL